MKRLSASILTLAALALTGCSSLPQSSGSIHPAVLTQNIGEELNGGTVIFDETARGTQTFDINYELTSDKSVNVTLVCPRPDQTLTFEAKANSAPLWSGSASVCDSDFSDKTTFTPGAQSPTGNWNLTVTTSDKTDYRVIVCVENL